MTRWQHVLKVGSNAFMDREVAEPNRFHAEAPRSSSGAVVSAKSRNQRVD
jgi:hypothetical protein